MNRFIFSLFIIVPFLAGAQPYTWQWLRSAQGNNSEVVNSICTDPSGNVIVTGYSYSTNFKLAGNLFPNLGNYDFFVASYDLAGNELWAFTGGGIYDDVGKSVTTDALGNVYVAGYFYSPQITVASSATLSSSGLGDGFLLKLDQNGNVLWHKSFGNTGDENINGISSDGSDIFITGYFHSDTIVCGVDTLINAGVNDVFLCKLDGAGSFDWARGLKGVASDAGYAVENDASGNVFVTGTFQGPYLAHANDTLHGQGSSDAFICKFSSTGSMVWAQAAGGIYNDEGYDLASDKSGNIYLTGTYNSPTLTIGNFSLVNQGNFDLFLARFDSMGNTSWILSEGGIFDDTGYGLATD